MKEEEKPRELIHPYQEEVKLSLREILRCQPL